MQFKVHFPLKPIRDIHYTKMDTFRGTDENIAKVIKDGLCGFTLIQLRELDYLMIAEQWESSMIAAYQKLQEKQFIEEYGQEEYY